MSWYWKAKQLSLSVSMQLQNDNGKLAMIPIGYMAKRIVQRPGWLHAPNVKNIYSVSNCVSANFTDYIKFWRHNGYWLFDDPQIIHELAQEQKIDIEDLTFFYYEAHE